MINCKLSVDCSRYIIVLSRRIVAPENGYYCTRPVSRCKFTLCKGRGFVWLIYIYQSLACKRIICWIYEEIHFTKRDIKRDGEGKTRSPQSFWIFLYKVNCDRIGDRKQTKATKTKETRAKGVVGGHALGMSVKLCTWGGRWDGNIL